MFFQVCYNYSLILKNHALNSAEVIDFLLICWRSLCIRTVNKILSGSKNGFLLTTNLKEAGTIVEVISMFSRHLLCLPSHASLLPVWAL